MVNVLFLFPRSTDLKETDDFISNMFLPGLKQMHGLRTLKLSEGELMSPGGPPPYSRIVEAAYDSLDVVMNQVLARRNPEADEKMKSLGVLILMYEVKEP